MKEACDAPKAGECVSLDMKAVFVLNGAFFCPPPCLNKLPVAGVVTSPEENFFTEMGGKKINA